MTDAARLDRYRAEAIFRELEQLARRQYELLAELRELQQLRPGFSPPGTPNHRPR
jgi:hypothetical protein